MVYQPKKSRTKDQAVAVAFRLFIGTVVIIRLLSYASTSTLDDGDLPPPGQEALAKLDALSATLDSAELCRRGYDLTHDRAYLLACQKNARTIGDRLDALRGKFSEDAGQARVAAMLDKSVRNWMQTLCDANTPRASRPAEISRVFKAMHDSVDQPSPQSQAIRSDRAISSRLVALSLTLFELTVLVTANWAFHRFMRRRLSTEDVLRRKEQFARSTVDALPTHIAVLDCNGIILATNRAWREFTDAHGGLAERANEGSNYLIMCDAADGQRCVEAGAFGAGIRAVLVGKKEEFSIEYAAHSRHERRWFVGRVTPFPGNDDSLSTRNVPRLVVSHHNITARKLAEEAVQKAKEQAEFANISKSAFLANTSHELRTPMTAILGYAEMLLDAGQSAEDRRSSVQTIRRNGEHLLHIINDLLDISKIEAQKVTVEKITTPLPQLVADVIGLTRPWAIKKGLAYDVEFLGEIPVTIESDPLRAKQVLVNLIANAIKFTETGSVRLTIRREITYFRQAIHFQVTDTGIGMTGPQIAKLFQPFTQADESTTRKFGGTGLGLTISQRLSRLLGGDIVVQSTPGQGSTFSVHIDAGPRENIQTIQNLTVDMLTVGADEQSLDDFTFLEGRVLLAEDGEDNQNLLATHLRKAGLEVVIAVNGRQAVDQIKLQNFDLVLMDMQMPEMDGYSATQTLRLLGHHLPIIALTANAMSEDRVRCLEAGCTEYLSKPISRAQLLRAAAKFLKPADQPKLSPPEPEPATPPAADPKEPADQSIQSEFSNEPAVKRLLEKFVERLPERVNTMSSLLAEQNLAALRQAVHQLKGAGGGYGFPRITEIAGIAEDHLRSDSDFESISRDISALIEVVRRVQGYNRSREQIPGAAPAPAAS